MRPLGQSLHPVITGVLIKEGEIPGMCTHRGMTTWPAEQRRPGETNLQVPDLSLPASRTEGKSRSVVETTPSVVFVMAI